jgi:adenosylcobinamide kinase/adenosylcobinamide-phosphate guanylyltransferase
MYTFVTGGYRSGRSNYALRRASELGPPPWLYVAAGVDTDDAIRKRIERQRRDAEAIWTTATMPDPLAALTTPGALDRYGAAVFDGLTAWLDKRIRDNPADSDAAIVAEITTFADRLYRLSVPVVLVSTEMSWGVLPERPEAARVVKLLSSANQILANQAAAMVLMVSGVPLRLR